MAKEFFGFFDSREGDVREYTEADMVRYTQTMVASGVSEREALKVTTARDGLKVNIAYGNAMVGGYYYALEDDGTSICQLQMSAPVSNPRIDRIVLRLSTSDDAKKVTLLILQGEEATTPSAPALQRNETVYEISLAQVYMTPGLSQIAEAMITDERKDDKVCGLIRGREEGAYDLAAQAQATAETGVQNAAAAQATADSAVAKADAAQSTANTANTKATGTHHWGVGPVSVSVAVAGWNYDEKNDRYYKDHTVTGLATTMIPFATASNVGFKFPLCGCEGLENEKLRLYMTNKPTVAGTVVVYGLAVRG